MTFSTMFQALAASRAGSVEMSADVQPIELRQPALVPLSSPGLADQPALPREYSRPRVIETDETNPARLGGTVPRSLVALRPTPVAEHYMPLTTKPPGFVDLQYDGGGVGSWKPPRFLVTKRPTGELGTANTVKVDATGIIKRSRPIQAWMLAIAAGMVYLLGSRRR